MDRLSTSPSSLIESPRPVVGHKRVNSFVATLKGAFFDDFCFEDSPDYVTSFKKVIIDGRDVLALRSEDIEKMSKDAASELLFQLHFDGNLRKKGFRGLQMWKRRFFSISSSSFLYYDVSNHKVPRHKTEITADGKVMVENISGHPFAFSIQPNKLERTYILEAYSMPQRDQWIRFFSLLIALQRRLSSQGKSSATIHESMSLLDVLGKGRYGVVRLGQNKKTGEMYAVKVISRGNIDDAILRQELTVLREIKDRVHNDCIVRVIDIYEDPLLVHVVMEYMGGGDLYHRLVHKRRFTEREAATVIRRIGGALETLHENHIYHLDVKPENIIYESNDAHAPMKLTDFGCSLLADHFNRDTNEIVGTAGFMAPEVISRCEYSDKADVFSLGVTLFILLMGYAPFACEDAKELLRKTVNERIEYDPRDWDAVSEDALLLVKNMLAKNPEERLSMREVLAFPWVTNPPPTSLKWQKRYESVNQAMVQMSLPSTLPGSHMPNI
ncbi:calcium-dependent protein kinase [Blastocystis sp. ATCC 50177/Nand II]|uniref:Calcium-dependent protein kinase n=1 Tax=Blastocystis sp. subtype 1 (strain ATCC 50177 / NandII) TaxID=478820 RepID=A0A196SJ16_BLAHN|nr:calcium-dependent protein kinase [Blastocystis sp. ATCC 50177/Nand II]